jgi:hypothetical protein
MSSITAMDIPSFEDQVIDPVQFAEDEQDHLESDYKYDFQELTDRRYAVRAAQAGSSLATPK